MVVLRQCCQENQPSFTSPPLSGDRPHLCGTSPLHLQAVNPTVGAPNVASLRFPCLSSGSPYSSPPYFFRDALGNNVTANEAVEVESGALRTVGRPAPRCGAGLGRPKSRHPDQVGQ